MLCFRMKTAFFLFDLAERMQGEGKARLFERSYTVSLTLANTQQCCYHNGADLRATLGKAGCFFLQVTSAFLCISVRVCLLGSCIRRLWRPTQTTLQTGTRTWHWRARGYSARVTVATVQTVCWPAAPSTLRCTWRGNPQTPRHQPYAQQLLICLRNGTGSVRATGSLPDVIHRDLHDAGPQRGTCLDYRTGGGHWRNLHLRVRSCWSHRRTSPHPWWMFTVGKSWLTPIELFMFLELIQLLSDWLHLILFPLSLLSQWWCLKCWLCLPRPLF